jgi:tRNA nucleotidyltransferase (CCA-adding enzyme)
MTLLNQIRVQSLRKIQPTKADLKEASTIFSKVKKALSAEIKARAFDVAFIELEGSSGIKQTQLRGWKELDVFIGVPVSVLPDSFENTKTAKPLIRRLLKKMVRDVAVNALKRTSAEDIQVAYAEHPYVVAQLDGYKVDIVFCFDLTRDYITEYGPITAVDRTPHHSRFIHEHLSEAQRDDVRLLKAFFQSSYVYGDSSPIGRSGFTGFSTEMLIFHTQTLESAFEYLSNFQPQPLDFFNRSPNSLEQKFAPDFFIISDPIDPNRNIASSISKRAYSFTTHKARQLLESPSVRFFDRQPIPQLPLSELNQLEPNYFVIEFQDQTGWHYTKTRDKLYRYFSKLSRFLSQESTGERRFGFVFFEELFREDTFVIALHIENAKLSRTFIRAGPPQNYVEGVDQFLARHPDAFLENGRYHIEIPRPFTNADQTLRHYLTENQISPKLRITNITREGSTVIGKQALWILIRAVQPFIRSKQK